MSTTLSERLDALLDDRDAQAIGEEIVRTESRLAILKAMQAELAKSPPPEMPPVNGKKKNLHRPPGGYMHEKRGKPSRPLNDGQLDDLAFKLGIFLKSEGPKRRDGLRNHLAIDDTQLDEL